MELSIAWASFKDWLCRVTNTYVVSKDSANNTHWKGSWGEVTWSWGLALSLVNGDKRALLHICPIYGNFYIRLKFLDKRMSANRTAFHKYWGFHTYNNSIHWVWGTKTKITYLPWARRVVKRFTYGADGKFHKVGTVKPHIFSREYTYILNSGEVQKTIATCEASAYRLGYYGLQWLPFVGNMNISLRVTFQEPIGEGVGSYKGGTSGVYFTLEKGLTPEAGLAHMEKTMKFYR